MTQPRARRGGEAAYPDLNDGGPDMDAMRLLADRVVRRDREHCQEAMTAAVQVVGGHHLKHLDIDTESVGPRHERVYLD